MALDLACWPLVGAGHSLVGAHTMLCDAVLHSKGHPAVLSADSRSSVVVGLYCHCVRVWCPACAALLLFWKRCELQGHILMCKNISQR
jgi:hypothetical protein